MTMIERVARIIELSLERHGVSDFEGTLDDARAAIEAMRDAEPSGTMMSALWSAKVSNTKESFAECWRAMLNAALSEGKEGE